MKVCPICKTKLFEDMEVCYGCMYRFGSNPRLEQRLGQCDDFGEDGHASRRAAEEQMGERSDDRPGSQADARNRDIADLQTADVRSMPVEPIVQSASSSGETSRQWAVRLEAHNSVEPDQTWVFEFMLPSEAMSGHVDMLCPD